MTVCKSLSTHLFRFPLQLEKRHVVLSGDSPLDLKRRNAVTNALIDLLGERSGADSLLARECLYAIAPLELWQFYSAHGLSGSCKSSYYGRMVYLYKAVLVAVVTRTGKEKSAAVLAISEVLKTIHNRSGPYKYRKAHPEEVFRHSLGQTDRYGNVVIDFTKRLVKGRKRPASLTTSAAAVKVVDTTNTAPDEEIYSECRRNPARQVWPSLLQVPSEEERSKHARYDSDDFDIDCNYSPPKGPPVFK